MTLSPQQRRALRDELRADPKYAGLDDSAAAAALNGRDRDHWVALSAAEMFEAIDSAEFSALGPADVARVDRVLGLGGGIATGPGSKARAEFVAVFGAQSATVVALAARANRRGSRAAELGLPPIRVGWVAEGRS